jgi:rare lipoprotein A
MSAFTTETSPTAVARPADTNPVIPMAHNVPSAEIVTAVPAPQPPVRAAITRRPSVFTRLTSGLASWYGEVLQGHTTASGRIFDKEELTAAHRTLPFGSKVKVTDLRNRRSVIVTITDRGVLNADRVIDLSLAAARQLGMVKMGVDPVRLELMARQSTPAMAH